MRKLARDSKIRNWPECKDGKTDYGCKDGKIVHGYKDWKVSQNSRIR